MIIPIIKNSFELLILRIHKKGEIGFREIVIISMSLIAGAIFLYLVVKRLNVSPKT